MSSDLIRGPKWRTRTTATRRHAAATVTFAVIVAFGLVVMWGCVRVLQWLDAPGWVRVSVWAVPTVGAAVWTLVRPRIAGVSDDDDDTWVGYSTRWVMVGELEPRPAAVRVVAALVFGAPVVWSAALTGVLTIVGII